MQWPPTLADLKTDRGITDDRDDERLRMVLDAAVVVAARLREGELAFGLPDEPAGLPAPGDDVALGTIRLAARWHDRRRSPDALIAMADLGSARVPTFDADIEQLLQVGRHRRPIIA